jgi:hypothetical protein
VEDISQLKRLVRIGGMETFVFQAFYFADGVIEIGRRKVITIENAPNLIERAFFLVDSLGLFYKTNSF